MTELVGWKIFYDDREPFSSENGTPEEAPLDGVQVIIQRWSNGVVEKLHSNDYYFWVNGKHWIDGSHVSMLTWMRKAVPCLKYGRFTDNEHFKEIKERAFHDNL